MLKRHVTSVAIVLTIGLSPTLVSAQTEDTAAQRADARLSRIDRIRTEIPTRSLVGAEGASERKPSFNFTVTAPFTYNTNVENAEHDRKTAFHAAPSAVLAYAQQTGQLRFFARVGTDLDEYTEHTENDASTLFGRVGLKLYDSGLGNVQPYIQYAPTIIYGSGFSDHQLTLHTFTLGAGGKTAVGGNTLSFDLNLARREATIADVERTQISAMAEISGDLVVNKVSWSVGATVQGRFYTGGTNDGRNDLNIAAVAGLSVDLGSGATLDVSASLERNASNRAGKDYTTFDVGPSLALSVPFG